MEEISLTDEIALAKKGEKSTGKGGRKEVLMVVDIIKNKKFLP